MTDWWFLRSLAFNENIGLSAFTFPTNSNNFTVSLTTLQFYTFQILASLNNMSCTMLSNFKPRIRFFPGRYTILLESKCFLGKSTVYVVLCSFVEKFARLWWNRNYIRELHLVSPFSVWKQLSSWMLHCNKSNRNKSFDSIE